MSKTVIGTAIAIPIVIIIAVVGFISVGKDAAEAPSKVATSPTTNQATTPLASTPVSPNPAATIATPLATDETSSPVSTNSSQTATTAAGTKSASVSFKVPEGHVEQMSITITTDASGIITDATADQSASNRESVQYSGRFESAYKAQVVAKKLSGLSLSRIGGASLTTAAFNKALTELK